MDDPTSRRPSTTHDRPTRTPFGPRVRTRTITDVDNVQLPATTTTTTTTTTTMATRTFVAPPPLTAPPTVSFESTPVPWKGLPFDAAQWMFSSIELQDIVSKAIRLSARESFVRLLSLHALETDIPQEADRLGTERATAQAKWRFEVGRRTMLLQALNSTAASAHGVTENEGENLVAGFIPQLASSIASCDTLLASILHLSDQQSQIALVQQQHWASALAVALRKLNKAYERQGQELKHAKERVQTLEDELEEAWREAEKMAVEFDDLEHDVADSDHSESTDDRPDEDTEADRDARAQDTGSADLQTMQDTDETGTLGDVTINTDIAVVVGVTATAVASKATLFSSPGTPKLVDKYDTKSVRSVKSTRSRRSIRDGPTHVSRISAARTRSRAASNASLRLPKALRSPTATHPSPIDAPPVPLFPPPNALGQSFLDMDMLMHERTRKDLPPPRHPEPSVALPTPPHSAGLPPTRVPSIWLETDGGKSTRLNGLDRTHSLHIFSSLTNRTPHRARRSNLVMSLKGSDRSDSATGSPVEPASEGSSVGASWTGNGNGRKDGNGNGNGNGAGSPISSGSPVSLPTHALHVHVRGPSDGSDANGSDDVTPKGGPRPGSAGARLTTGMVTTVPVPVATPRRSLVSRASSVILRRLSAATMGSMRATVTGGDKRLSPTRSREALRMSGGSAPLVEGWREGEEEGQGEVMLIGAPYAESSEGP